MDASFFNAEEWCPEIDCRTDVRIHPKYYGESHENLGNINANHAHLIVTANKSETLAFDAFQFQTHHVCSHHGHSPKG
jgi:hypothetical protein